MPAKCHVINCSKPAVSKGFCDTHRKRLKRHGHLEQTRPVDWGSREKHPAYRSWSNLIRFHKLNTHPKWINDFWAFAASIPEKPSPDAKAYRVDFTKPWGPDNFYWKEPRVSPERRQQKSSYMREWSRLAREANPDYFKNSYLKKHYGVTLDWYNEQLSKQGGVCAICRNPETAVIHGKQISLAVDHCHDTGAVRGLLCKACNQAIGLLRHDASLLKAAIEYLDTQE
jgi:hypothetical protein